VEGSGGGGGNDDVSDDEARAAVEMATEALSRRVMFIFITLFRFTFYRRIVAAVDEISNPNADAPKATKQLAARMAKVIVEAVATKTGKTSSGPRTSSFTNKHGEEWQLTVDAKVRACVCVSVFVCMCVLVFSC